MSTRIKVKIIENGPILVSDFDSIRYCDETLNIENRASLCRCGSSQNAPFCDGSHIEAKFSDENTLPEQNGIRTWEGKTIKTYFNSNICMHAAVCQPLDELRKKNAENGDQDAANEIAEIVTNCPSGALSFEMIDQVTEVEFDSSNEIEIVEGGEIRFRCQIECSEIEIQERQPGNRITLCRCGLSKNKPFCDASHSNKSNFR